MALQYATPGLQTAAACSGAIFSCPLEGIKDQLILTQDFQQAVVPMAPWIPLALNTPHPDYPDFILTKDGPLKDLTGAQVRWTREYAKIPTNYKEPGGNYSYHFIGFVGDFGNVSPDVIITGRERFTLQAPVTIHRDFFLVDPSGSPSGDGTLANPYDDFSSIPINPEYIYYWGANPNIKVEYIAEAGFFPDADTTPTIEAYEALITAGTPINVEPSKITRWHGNIFMRETLSVLPQ